MTQGERVRLVRKELNLTLEKFGERIGMKKSSLSQVENGVNSLTEKNIRIICKEFGVDYGWLVFGEGEMFFRKTQEETDPYFDPILENESELAKNLFKVFKQKFTTEDWKQLFEVINNVSAYLKEIEEEDTKKEN